MEGPSHHLLRTLAAVPPGSPVLILGDDAAGHAAPLQALGFAVTRADAPALEAAFDWVVATDAGDESRVLSLLRGARHALVPGGWVWIAVDWELPHAEALTGLAIDAELALAEAPAVETRGSHTFLHGIYRRVDAETRG